jgi:N-ethylmaleimide reductase
MSFTCNAFNAEKNEVLFNNFYKCKFLCGNDLKFCYTKNHFIILYFSNNHFQVFKYTVHIIDYKNLGMDDNKLFDFLDLKGLQLKNRIVMAPMTRIRSNNPGNTATALTAEYYGQRATAGLIITEGTFISAEAVGAIGVPGIYTKEQVEGWKLVTQTVHEKEGKIFAQLWHVGRLSHPEVLGGELPLAPSALNPFDKVVTPNGVKDTVVAREMTLENIKKTINDFHQAAINAMEAGFDGVEIHGANGYLLHQFFNLYSNKRHDQ